MVVYVYFIMYKIVAFPHSPPTTTTLRVGGGRSATNLALSNEGGFKGSDFLYIY